MTDQAATGIVYEVNLDVDATIADAYRAWLDAHVAQVLALPGFVCARRFDILEPLESGRIGVCVHYQLRNSAALASYLQEHAPRMRAEGVARFGDGFRATRRVLRMNSDTHASALV